MAKNILTSTVSSNPGVSARVVLPDHQEAGFTMIELLIVVMIIGILAMVAIPKYHKAVETSYSDEAISTLQMIGSAYRIGALNYNGFNLIGSLNLCLNLAPVNCGASVPQQCDIINCGFLTNQTSSQSRYTYYLNNLSGGNASVCVAFGVPNTVACALRIPCAGQVYLDAGSPPQSQCTNTVPYNQWAYVIDRNGLITQQNGAPPPP